MGRKQLSDDKKLNKLIAIRISPGMEKKLTKAALQSNQTMSQVIRNQIEKMKESN